MKCCYATALLSALSAACLYGLIGAPSPGFVRYGDLPIQSLYGISGNLVLAGASFGTADAISFSDSAGLIAANGRIKLIRLDGSELGEYRYAEGSVPLLGTDAASNGALAWLAAPGSLLWWDGKTFTTIAVDSDAFAGRINCVSLVNSNIARFLVTHPEGGVSAVDIGLPTGNLISSDSLPGVQGPASQFGSHMLWSESDGLEIEMAGGVQHTLSSPTGRFTAEQMSSRWVHLYFPSNRTHWALHLGGSQPSLSRLPAPIAAREALQ